MIRILYFQVSQASLSKSIHRFSMPYVGHHTLLLTIHQLVEHWLPIDFYGRQDSAALYYQHGIQLQGVFDTQVAHAQLERHAGRSPYQASAKELMQ